MAAKMIVRLLATLTVLIGLGMYGNVLSVVAFRHVHMTLGALLAIAALVVVRESNGRSIAGIGLHILGRFAPLLPLCIGIAMLLDGSLRTTGLITLHGLLGLIAVGLVEMALSRRREPRPEVGASTH